MRKLIDFDRDKIGPLHCDGCHYETPEPVSLDPKWIGTSCPACGRNMLTARDYRSMNRLIRLIAVFNFVFSPLLLFVRRDAKATPVSANIHNDVLKIKEGDAP